VEAIRDAVSGTPAREAAEPAAVSSVSSAPAARSEARDQHTCGQCGQTLVIVYERRGPDESQSIAPVACPYCWKVGHFTIGSWAAVGSDYKAEKA
jgi:DNA-directed RNA polymerase subunit RPC12/RpoP